MRNTSLLTVLAVLIGVGIWLVALWVGMHSACIAYHSTPDVAEFAHFAMPVYSGHQGKFTFLFGPSIAMLVAAALLLSIRTNWLEKMRRLRLNLIASFPLRAALLGVSALLLLVVTFDHISRSTAATARMHWHGSSVPNKFVESFCLLF